MGHLELWAGRDISVHATRHGRGQYITSPASHVVPKVHLLYAPLAKRIVKPPSQFAGGLDNLTVLISLKLGRDLTLSAALRPESGFLVCLKSVH